MIKSNIHNHNHKHNHIQLFQLTLSDIKALSLRDKTKSDYGYVYFFCDSAVIFRLSWVKVPLFSVGVSNSLSLVNLLLN